MSALASMGCDGSAHWQILSEPHGNAAASGSVTCPCSPTTLFSFIAGSAPLTPGNYQVVLSFDGTQHESLTTQSNFTVTIALPSQSAGTSALPVVFLALMVCGGGASVMDETRQYESRRNSGQE